jgi:hypothetical protein
MAGPAVPLASAPPPEPEPLPVPVPVNLPALPVADRLAAALAATAGLGVTTAARMDDEPQELQPTLPAVSMPAPTFQPGALCGFEQQDRDTGQWGRCQRPLYHKGNCGQWLVFDKYD